MKIHKAAKAFPSMSASDFLSLKSDIALHGLREPIWVKNGAIIDGRHRWKACAELNISCPAREFEGDDILSFVISGNVRRRHLSAKQKRHLVEKLLRENPSRSNRGIAKSVGVSHTSVANARDQMEQRGDVATVATVTDSIGRVQVARRSSSAFVVPEAELAGRRLIDAIRGFDLGGMSDPSAFVDALRAQVKVLAARLRGEAVAI